MKHIHPRFMPSGLRVAGPLALLLIAAMAGCGEPPTLDPPDVRWGQDVCSDCGMILSDDRYAAAVVSIRDDERQVKLFDDIGEMFDVPAESFPQAASPDPGRSRRWVRDAETRRWIDAESATYLRSAALHTPMGRGIAAFADEADAKAMQAEFQGELLRIPDMRALDSNPPTTPLP